MNPFENETSEIIAEDIAVQIYKDGDFVLTDEDVGDCGSHSISLTDEELAKLLGFLIKHKPHLFEKPGTVGSLIPKGLTQVPMYKHTCAECVFLGGWDLHDLYFCRHDGNGDVPTVIARFGDALEDCECGLGVKTPHLNVARDLAVTRGLLAAEYGTKPAR